MASLECLSYCDYSLAIKAGVHFTLCGGTICKLGTAKHHEKYLPGQQTRVHICACASKTKHARPAGCYQLGVRVCSTLDFGPLCIPAPSKRPPHAHASCACLPRPHHAPHHAAPPPPRPGPAGIDNLSLPGCFGMTELGHGSNVMGIETTAVYDPAAKEFVINTPNDDASKFWIGES